MDLGVSFVLGALSALVVALLLLLWRLPFIRHGALEEFREGLEREAEVVARERLQRERATFEAALAATRAELKELEGRCRMREDGIDRRLEGLEERERSLVAREAALKAAEAALEARRAEVDLSERRYLRELERVAGMRREEAEHKLLGQVEERCRAEAAEVAERVDAELTADLEARARGVLLRAAQRVAAPVAREALVTVVPLVDDELKTVLVGREGRNARAFEQATGVDLLIDDTPGVVVISAYDPVRREVARRALIALLEEGRVDPERVGEAVSEARTAMETATEELGREAAAAAGVAGLHARLHTVLGRLEFVTDGGQPLRSRAVEVAHLAAALADEVGGDVDLARRAGLLHAIGAALAHDEAGGSAAAGAEFARRCGESAAVTEAIAAALEPGPAPGPLAALVATAAAVARHRPGAQEPAVEVAVRRRGDLEALAHQHPGVSRAYAVRAGRELRVVVDPARVSEKASLRLARDVARRVEEQSPGAGRVKVTVVRSTEASEDAG